MKKIILLAFAAWAIAMTSCVRETLNPEDYSSMGPEDHTFLFSIVDESPVTRSSVAEETATRSNVIDLGTTEDGMPLRFVETVSSAVIPADSILTKGAPATTDNVKTLYGSFSAVAYYEDNSAVSVGGQTEFPFLYRSANNNWAHIFESDPWGAHSEMYFFTYMPEKPAGTTFNPSTHTISFSYTTPSAVADQKDLLFGGRNTTKAEFSSNPLSSFPITFHHALSGVQFAIGNDANSTTITQVTLKGIVNTGTFVITPGAGTPVACTPGATTACYSLTDLGETFWLIPQTLSNDAELEVTYTINGGTSKTVSAKINAALSGALTLAAGELHTFTLNPDEVNVTVTDEINGSGVKNNLVITNTGNVEAHLRAVIVANWQDGSGNIVASWDFVPAEFEGLPGTGWTLAADGFYYTTATVAPGADAPTLFTSYTPPTTLPVAGAHLVMDIAVQAVNAKPTSWN